MATDSVLRPPTNLAWAVTATVVGAVACLTGFAFGLVALIEANTVNPKWDAGNLAGASKASRRAKAWSIVGLVVDVLGFALLIAVLVTT